MLRIVINADKAAESFRENYKDPYKSDLASFRRAMSAALKL